MNNSEIREKLAELVSLSQELDLYFKQDEKTCVEPEYGLWKPKEGEGYYYISDSGLTTYDYWHSESLDFDRYLIGNCFKTKEQAEKHLEHLKVETQLRDIAGRLNKSRKIDWEDSNQMKFYLYYTFKDNSLDQDRVNIYKTQGTIYCLDENFKDVAIQEIGEDRLKRFCVVCSRA